MSEHRASIVWKRATPDFVYKTYNRDHVWRFDNGLEVGASATPDYLGNAANLDPEEAFVASVASCHMLTFLAAACGKRFVVDSYEDDAVGELGKDGSGRMAILRVVLRPRIVFGGAAPSPEQLKELHDFAHHHCFIANSVKSEVVVE